MDNQPSSPVETGAPMNYPEHEKTYEMFLSLTKWVTMSMVVLLIAMAAGFFGGVGFFGSFILFIVLNVAGFYLLR